MKYQYWLAALTFALSLISFGASADNVFILESEGLLTIPPENLEFLEGLDETTPFEKLQSAEWSPALVNNCLLYTSPSPRDGLLSRMPSSA